MIKRTCVTLALLALAAPAGAGAAVAAPGDEPLGGIRAAVFKVTLHGKQTNAWTSHHSKASQCDMTLDGSGSERMRFRSPKPLKVVVTSLPGVDDLLLRVKRRGGGTGTGIGDNDVPVRGTVTRQGAVVASEWDPLCGGKGGGSAIAPDCGTKRFGGVGLTLRFLTGDQLALDNGDVPEVGFANCPILGTGFPQVLTSDSGFKTITSKFPRAEVFDRSLRKFIVIGRGTQARTDAETSDTTRIRWEAEFVRVK